MNLASDWPSRYGRAPIGIANVRASGAITDRASVLPSVGNAGTRLRKREMRARTPKTHWRRTHTTVMGTLTDIVELRTRKGFSANQ